MPFKVPGYNDNIPNTASVKLNSKTDGTLSVRSISFKSKSSSSSTNVWNFSGLTLNVLITDRSGRNYTGNEIAKLLNLLTVTRKDINTGNESLVFSNTSFGGSDTNIIGSSYKIYPGYEKLKVTVNCKGFVGAEKIQLVDNGGRTINILTRSRDKASDDLTQGTTTSFVTINSSTIKTGPVVLKITLDRVYLESQVDIATSRIYFSPDRYSDYAFIFGDFSMKTITKVNRTKLRVFASTFQYSHGSLSSECQINSDDGSYYFYDGVNQQNVAVLDPTDRNNPILYYVYIAPNDGTFIDYFAVNVIVSHGVFIGTADRKENGGWLGYARLEDSFDIRQHPDHPDY